MVVETGTSRRGVSAASILPNCQKSRGVTPCFFLLITHATQCDNAIHYRAFQNIIAIETNQEEINLAEPRVNKFAYIELSVRLALLHFASALFGCNKLRNLQK
jgi:hypothetical protein